MSRDKGLVDKTSDENRFKARCLRKFKTAKRNNVPSELAMAVTSGSRRDH